MNENTFTGLIAKSVRTLATARLASDSGDFGNACSLAYYAMFHAARAALLTTNAAHLDGIKTHAGLLNAFSQQLVKHGPFTVEYAAMLKQVEHKRLVADYRGDPLEADDAVASIDAAGKFISAIRAEYAKSQP